MEKVQEFFRPCAVDPWSINTGDRILRLWRYRAQNIIFTNAEYHALTGSVRRNKALDEEKKRTGIKQIESLFPTAKTHDPRIYQHYLQYFFAHFEQLFQFSTTTVLNLGFMIIKGDKKALEETIKVLINDGRIYDRQRRRHASETVIQGKQTGAG